MKSVLFIDEVGAYEYDDITRNTKAQGGTENWVTDLADHLAVNGYHVTVAGKQRKQSHIAASGVQYEPLDSVLITEGYNPDAIICMRMPATLRFCALWPQAKRFYALHDLNVGWFIKDYNAFVQFSNSTLVFVSKWHMNYWKSAMEQQLGQLNGITFDYVYANLPDNYGIAGADITVDPFKLMHMSAPWKGLARTVKVYDEIRNRDPRFKLYITDPGYGSEKVELVDGCIHLGAIDHPTVLRHMAQSFCLLHCNKVPETFGVVYAEAIGAGVPIIAHKGAGAVDEVINDERFLMNTDDTEAVIKRLFHWRDTGRPKPNLLNHKFRRSNAFAKWIRLIEGNKR